MSSACRWFLAVLTLLVTLGAFAQQRPAPRKSAPAAARPAQPAERPKFKAVWEPVNYKEDINLTDVFFTSAEVGWVSGDHGTILYTKDGGTTWTAQLGGDPQSADASIHDLRFVDGSHGWAHQGSGGGNKLLRTTDGESWEQVGKLGGHFGYGSDYFFFSATSGLQVRDEPYDIARTTDGGKTWRPVVPACTAKMEIEGLTREVGCRLKSLHFPSQNVGYAVGSGAKALFVLRTDDGGENWKVAVSPDLTTNDSTFFRQEVFFTSENVGFVTLNDRKILATSDGGESWRSVVGTSRGKIKFADPEVGWSWDGSKLTYTVNGGKTWSSREVRFPAEVTAFSLPTRQRGYVVSHHGMIYRYRIVPIEYSVKGMIEAPMMPGAGQ